MPHPSRSCRQSTSCMPQCGAFGNMPPAYKWVNARTGAQSQLNTHSPLRFAGVTIIVHEARSLQYVAATDRRQQQRLACGISTVQPLEAANPAANPAAAAGWHPAYACWHRMTARPPEPNASCPSQTATLSQGGWACLRSAAVFWRSLANSRRCTPNCSRPSTPSSSSTASRPAASATAAAPAASPAAAMGAACPHPQHLYTIHMIYLAIVGAGDMLMHRAAAPARTWRRPMMHA